jgi:hypothetical protein
MVIFNWFLFFSLLDRVLILFLVLFFIRVQKPSGVAISVALTRFAYICLVFPLVISEFSLNWKL